jgi:hypothetical protein
VRQHSSEAELLGQLKSVEREGGLELACRGEGQAALGGIHITDGKSMRTKENEF